MKKPVLPSADKCCGCSACYAACPQNAIIMHPDEEGFLQPLVDLSKCVGCGKCTKSCPVINRAKSRTPIMVLAARAKNENVLAGCSSGGVFTLFAENFLRRGGVVYGAAWNYPKCNVVHRKVANIADLEELKGSKYVQSEMGDIFKNVKRDIAEGHKVLFSGCPCQVAGLKRYLGDDERNLLTIDLICHGVPSPLSWKAFLEKRVDDYGAAVSKIISRRYCGWKDFVCMIEFCGSEKKYVRYGQQCTFFRAFFNNYLNRKSCHECSFRELKSGSDITIGDFWGGEKIFGGLNDNKGISAVLLNTEKGLDQWNLISEFNKFFRSELKVVCRYNPTVMRNYRRTWKREKFFSLIKIVDFDTAVRKVDAMGFFRRIRHFAWWLKRLVLHREINKLWL